MYLNFEITSYCNSKCYGCFRAHNQDNTLLNKHIDYDLFEKFIYEDCIGDDMSCILCGQLGEPILHPQIEKIIELCYFRFNSVAISTNGGNRNPNWYKKICQKFSDKIIFIFAIDGITQDINELYRKGVNFDKAFNNMLSCGKNALWNFIIFKHNVHQVYGASKLAEKYNIDIRFQPDASI